MGKKMSDLKKLKKKFPWFGCDASRRMVGQYFVHTSHLEDVGVIIYKLPPGETMWGVDRFGWPNNQKAKEVFGLLRNFSFFRDLGFLPSHGWINIEERENFFKALEEYKKIPPPQKKMQRLSQQKYLSQVAVDNDGSAERVAAKIYDHIVANSNPLWKADCYNQIFRVVVICPINACSAGEGEFTSLAKAIRFGQTSHCECGEMAVYPGGLYKITFPDGSQWEGTQAQEPEF